MSLYENWIKMAYDSKGLSNPKVWDNYLPAEQRIYEEIISEKTSDISGTVEELGQRFNIRNEFVLGFLDGINESVSEPLTVHELEETSEVKININFELLYKKMVEYKAEHLYSLPQWDAVFDESKRKELYKEQKRSTTVIKTERPNRNEPCPCNSGKKYKRCCGAN